MFPKFLWEIVLVRSSTCWELGGPEVTQKSHTHTHSRFNVVWPLAYVHRETSLILVEYKTNRTGGGEQYLHSTHDPSPFSLSQNSSLKILTTLHTHKSFDLSPYVRMITPLQMTSFIGEASTAILDKWNLQLQMLTSKQTLTDGGSHSWPNSSNFQWSDWLPTMLPTWVWKNPATLPHHVHCESIHFNFL